MTKKEIIDRVMYDADLTRQQASQAYDSIIDTVKWAMLHHEDIFVRGFATYKYTVSKPRKGRIIKTGETIDLPPKRKYKFILAKEMQQLLNAPQHDACPE